MSMLLGQEESVSRRKDPMRKRQSSRKHASGAGSYRPQGKCPRAFHVSCAISNPDVVFQTWEETESEPPPMSENAAPGTKLQPESRNVLKTKILCPTHNPVSPSLGCGADPDIFMSGTERAQEAFGCPGVEGKDSQSPAWFADQGQDLWRHTLGHLDEGVGGQSEG